MPAGSPSFAFTTTSSVVRPVLENDCLILKAWKPDTDLDASDHKAEGHTAKAIWDTGATNSVISKSVIETLELSPVGATQTYGVHGSKVVDVFLVGIALPNRIVVPELRVTLGELSGAGVLIGMDIITRGDFAVTNFRNRTVFSFCMPSQQTIDFVAEANRTRMAQRASPSPERRLRNRKKRKKAR